MVGLQILEQEGFSAMSQQQIEAFKSLMKPVMDAIAETGVTNDLEGKLNAQA